ncbi:MULTISPECIES: hypothetical protein [Actinosynnema]|uniref:hypothetical protein n=1 Tax=Actinosynnema TaxID=40566 RepID=UPI0020A53D96|nr:hypothetical protein [Actinosynnema pretiosum]MCP2092511.1 hypothetical protein [Actinosynnema pretiosum]
MHLGLDRAEREHDASPTRAAFPAPRRPGEGRSSMNETTSPLFRSLTELGVAHSTRTSARGVPYAALRLSGADGDLSVTAVDEQGALRLTAHDVLPEVTGERLAGANRRLPLARAYRSPDDGTLEVALGCHIGARFPEPLQVWMLLGHLVASCQLTVVGSGALGLPELGGSGVALPPTISRVALEDGRSAWVELGTRGDWFVASADYAPATAVPPGPEAEAVLQGLQRWTSAGRYCESPEGGLRAEVATPVLGDADALVDWTVNQARQMLQVAAHHLGLPDAGA